MLHREPAVKVWNSSAQTTSNGVGFPVLFDTEVFDRWGMHSTVSNTERLTIVVPGIYYVYASIQFTSNGTGRRLINMQHLNSSDVIRTTFSSFNIDAASTTVTQINAPGISLSADIDDYFRVTVLQSSGGDLDLVAATETVQTKQTLSAMWLAP